jgi:hypothetical protein
MMTSSSTCSQNYAINSGAEAAGRSQATEALRQNPDRSAAPTSASIADAGTRTQPRQHRLAWSWRFSPRQQGTSIRSASLKNTSSSTSLARIVVIEPNAPEVIVWVRGTDRSWRKAIRQGLDQEIDMPEIGVTLPLKEIYDGVEFPARPRLVAEEASPMPESELKNG